MITLQILSGSCDEEDKVAVKHQLVRIDAVLTRRYSRIPRQLQPRRCWSNHSVLWRPRRGGRQRLFYAAACLNPSVIEYSSQVGKAGSGGCTSCRLVCDVRRRGGTPTCAHNAYVKLGRMAVAGSDAQCSVSDSWTLAASANTMPS